MPPAARLSSRQHELVRRFRDVARKGDTELVVLEGERLVTEALDAGVTIEVLLTDGPSPLADRARRSGSRVHEATRSVIEAGSPVRTPSGLLALARWRTAELDTALAGDRPLVLGLCSLQDPGNVGSAIRSGDALGATAVLALDESANPAGWKALRGSMGSAFHLPVARGDAAEAIGLARRRGLHVIAAIATGGLAPAAIDLTRPSLVLLGNEGAGLPADIVRTADTLLSIPMRRGVNSLNVAAAAALILDEARRQRQRQ